MRLFVGIELPDALKSSAAAAATSHSGRHRARRAGGADAMGPARQPSHHDLVPRRGARAASRCAGRVAKEPLDARSFTLRIGGAGAFPQSGAPRAIWLGLVAGREGLVAVHDELRPRLLPLGFVPEKRPYSPHLTIARVKDVRPSPCSGTAKRPSRGR